MRTAQASIRRTIAPSGGNTYIHNDLCERLRARAVFAEDRRDSHTMPSADGATANSTDGGDGATVSPHGIPTSGHGKAPADGAFGSTHTVPAAAAATASNAVAAARCSAAR